MTNTKIVLKDTADGFETLVPVVISHGHGFLEIRPAGYGEHGAESGHGAPVILEVHQGRLRAIVSPDITKEDFKIIDLEGARESLRPDDNEEAA